jgi:hypothetical protein
VLIAFFYSRISRLVPPHPGHILVAISNQQVYSNYQSSSGGRPRERKSGLFSSNGLSAASRRWPNPPPSSRSCQLPPAGGDKAAAFFVVAGLMVPVPRRFAWFRCRRFVCLKLKTIAAAHTTGRHFGRGRGGLQKGEGHVQGIMNNAGIFYKKINQRQIRPALACY